MIVNNNQNWISPGLSGKAEKCKYCLLQNKGIGFCPDTAVIEKPKLAIICDYPSKEDVLCFRPWSGSFGYSLSKNLLAPIGLTRDDVLICNVLRCYQPATGKQARHLRTMYPSGKEKESAENCCRFYDFRQKKEDSLALGGIYKYAPNLFFVSFGIRDIFTVGAYLRLTQKVFEKAVSYSNRFNVCILMGVQVMDLVAPQLSNKGGVKSWVGHYWEGSWPFTDEESAKIETKKRKLLVQWKYKRK